MWKDRLKRILIILLVAALVAGGIKVFTDWQKKQKARGQVISLPTQQIGEKISDLGEQILGKAAEVLPGGGALKEKLENGSSPTPSSNQNNSQTSTENEKVVKVETKTQEIIEIIKELPAEQLEAIKKQVFKDFCQKILEEK